MNFTLQKYCRESGVIPLDEWLDELSPVFRARVYANLARIEVGNFGNVKALQGERADNLYELRLFFGPGYRVYFGRDGNKLIILLCGGDKKTQRRDITEAKKLWSEYLQRKEK